VSAAVASAKLLVLEKPEVLAGFDRRVSFSNGAGDTTVSQAPAQAAAAAPPAPAAPPPALAEPLLVSQLLRRFAFGGSDALYQQATRQGYRQTVDQLLAQPAAQPPPFPGGEALVAGMNLNLDQLQQWWITHMLTTPTPFQERVALFMHGLFTTGARKVGTDNPFLVWQNRAWRDMAMADLKTILMRVSTDPAMLLYLDGNMSDGSGTPNQNFARELMERFSVGAVYTEQDVREVAMAVSGWRVPQAGKDTGKTGVFDAARHFPLPVDMMGKVKPMDLGAVIDGLLAHPTCAPFVTTRFVQEFVTPTPDAAYVNRLAANFRKSGYQVKTLLRDILLSPELAAQGGYRGMVKSPLDFMVGAARLVGADPAKAAPLIRQYAVALGHAPFDPPDVGGYPGGAGWVSPAGMLQRVNFATDLVATFKMPPATAPLVTRYLDGVLSPGASQALAAAPTEAQRLWTLLASPDAQVA
jgi:uncharacterized protein (DUF1800 family)